MLFCIWFVNFLLKCFEFVENTPDRLSKDLNSKPSCPTFNCYLILKSLLLSLKIFKMNIIYFFVFFTF